MKKQFFTTAAVLTAILFFLCQQANAQTWNQTGDASTAASRFGSTNMTNLRFITNNIERMRLDTLGRFGVGTLTPTANLHVNGSFRLVNGSQAAGRLLTSDASGLSSWATPSFWSLTGNTATNAVTNFLGTTDSVALVVRTRNLERMRVSALGLVGVGTAAPTATLHVNGSVRIVNGTQAAGRLLTSDASGLASWAAPSFWSLTGNAATNPAINFAGTTDSNAYVIRTRNIERMRVTALGAVGIGTSTPASALSVGANKFNVSSSDGDVIFTDPNGTLRFPATTGANSAMIQMFESGTLNRNRMVIAHSAAFPTWGLQYQDTLDKFNFLSAGTPVLTADLGSQRVGVGTANPTLAKLVVEGAVGGNTVGLFRGSATGKGLSLVSDYPGLYFNSYWNGGQLAMAPGFTGIVNFDPDLGKIVMGTSATAAVNAGDAAGTASTLTIDKQGFVGVGTVSPTSRLHVLGDASLTSPVIQVTNSFVGTADVRGITSYSKASDGWGYGIEATGGYIGGYFNSDAGAYAGTGYGVFANATGTTATRIGVYGTSSGGTDNWGGYFPTKSYMSELRVGGTQGATGYVAAINGKLIATEVRVDLQASWPDYVFSKDHDLLTIEALEAKINVEKHLPGVPSAEEMKQSGIMLGEMQTKTMEKVEENTLYIIQLNNKIKELEKKIEALTQKAN